jgi:bifunctional UDP-N-acetylglucosamine pyrophosphorylase/glucosamine-1-phosphate N-acetyltransferase
MMVPVGHRRRVLVLGRTTLDIFVRFSVFPTAGMISAMPRPRLMAGGTAANIAMVLSDLGLDVTLWTRLGRDDASNIICDELADHGIAKDWIAFDSTHHTTTSIINVHPNGEIAILQHQGALSTFCMDDYPLDRLGTFDVVLIGGALNIKGLDGEPMAWFLLRARELGVRTAVCLSRNTHLRDQFLLSLSHIDLLFMNRKEAADITQTCSVTEACEWFHQMGVRTVVVTQGPDGALVFDGETSWSVAGLRVGVVDTTGCGDAFVAGYLDAENRGLSPCECVEWANAVGAYNARTLGAVPPSLNRIEIKAMIQRASRHGECGAIVLAGGQSKRMEGTSQKLTLDLCGKSMICRCIETLREAGIHRIIVVLGHEEEAVRHCLMDQPVEFLAGESPPKGTGSAVKTALSRLPDLPGQILVVNGDTPLVRSETLDELHWSKETNQTQVAVCTAISTNPVRYGHALVVRDEDNEFNRVEHFDPDRLSCQAPEINTGVYVFDNEALRFGADRIPVAADGKIHFSDILTVLRQDGRRVLLHHSEPFEEFISVNTRQNLSEVEEILHTRENLKGNKT